MARVDLRARPDGLFFWGHRPTRSSRYDRVGISDTPDAGYAEYHKLVNTFTFSGSYNGYELHRTTGVKIFIVYRSSEHKFEVRYNTNSGTLVQPIKKHSSSSAATATMRDYLHNFDVRVVTRLQD